MTTLPIPHQPEPHPLPNLTGRPYRAVLRNFFGNALASVSTMQREGGDITGFRFTNRHIVLVNEPEATGEVLLTRADDFHKGPALSIYIKPLLGEGILSSEGDTHRRHRKLVQPAFAHRRIVGYADGMAALAEQTQARWHDGERFDLAEEMTALTLGIVGKTLFNVDDMESMARSVGSSVTLLMEFLTRSLRAPLRLPFAWIPPWRRNVQTALAQLDTTVYDMIDARRATGEDRGDLLSMLLLARDEDGQEMPRKQVRDEAMTLFLAGHETMANALAWTFALLCQNPPAYARLQREVDTVLQGRTPTYADLENLPYTAQVLKESMRLRPPAWGMARQAMRDTVIGGYRIPKGAVVIISPFLLHRRPDVWPDPERFDPDRFTPDREKARPRNTYLPFGGGARICIGAAFAQMEGQIVLATLAQRVTFALQNPDDALEMQPLITLRPKNGVPVVVTRR